MNTIAVKRSEPFQMAVAYEKERIKAEKHDETYDAKRCLDLRNQFIDECKGPRDEALALVVEEAKEDHEPCTNSPENLAQA